MTLSLWKGETPKSPLDVARDIVDAAALAHGVCVADLMGDRFIRKFAHARQDAYWRVRERLGWSYPHIGRFFGGRDHTTILHGILAHQARITEKKGAT